MRRGRPPHPDVLTPREWEVAQLISRGLTNQQIADELGISLSGAKYHVSEIITKLGVQRRSEVSVWLARSRPSRLAGLIGLFGFLRSKFETIGLAKITTTATLGGAVAALGVLAWLVLSTSSREDAVTVVNQGFSVVQDGHLTYAFLIQPVDKGMALENATYSVSFYDETGDLMVERGGALPLLLPGQQTAVAEEDIAVTASPTKMMVEVSGGVLRPVEGLPTFPSTPMDSFSGGGNGGGRSEAAGVVWNPYAEVLTEVQMTAVFFDSEDRILGGASKVIDTLQPGNQRVDIALEYGPAEEYVEDGTTSYLPPRVQFYIAPRSGMLSQLQAMRQGPAPATSATRPQVSWKPAPAPFFDGEEMQQPFQELYGPIRSLVYVIEGDGPAELVYETPRWIRSLRWVKDSTALHLDVLSQSATGDNGSSMYEGFLEGSVLLGVPDGAIRRELLARPFLSPSIVPSPVDGRAIFQASEAGMFLVEEDGSATQLQGLGERLEFLSWSPEGDAILVFSYETVANDIPVDGFLYAVPLDGGYPVRIEPPIDESLADSAAWSPDGTRIAFLADGQPRTFERAAQGDLFVMDLKTQKSKRLVESTENLPTPVWSPDGSWILLRGELIDAATGHSTQLLQERDDAIGGLFSPDGRYLLVTEQPWADGCQQNPLANRTWLYDLVTREDRLILDCEDGFYFAFSHSQQRWTDDSRQAALQTSSTWGGGHGHFWKASLVNVETGELVTLAERPEEGRVNVIASPDGERLFTTGDVLRLFDGEGSLIEAFEVPEGFEIREAGWSPDGSMIAFVAVPMDAFLGP